MQWIVRYAGVAKVGQWREWYADYIADTDARFGNVAVDAEVIIEHSKPITARDAHMLLRMSNVRVTVWVRHSVVDRWAYYKAYEYRSARNMIARLYRSVEAAGTPLGIVWSATDSEKIRTLHEYMAWLLDQSKRDDLPF